MRIAVASRDGQTLSGHIGKCAQWIVYEIIASPDAEFQVQEVARLELPKELVFHHYQDDQPHPLADCVAVIGASAGDSFVSKMRKRGMDTALTAETDPVKAVADYVCSRLTPPKPRPIGGLVCKLRDWLSSDK